MALVRKASQATREARQAVIYLRYLYILQKVPPRRSADIYASYRKCLLGGPPMTRLGLPVDELGDDEPALRHTSRDLLDCLVGARTGFGARVRVRVRVGVRG